jgi:hypothetical protein
MPVVAAASLLAALLVAPATPAEQSGKQVAQALKKCAPKTYEGALDCLDKILPVKEQAALAAPDGAIAAHIGLGMFIRNNWDLWQQGPLYRSMHSLGFVHPDDMSAAILDGFAARERGEAFDVSKKPAEYQERAKRMRDEAEKEGRAGSLSCEMPPLPEKPTEKQIKDNIEACFDQMAKKLEGDLK